MFALFIVLKHLLPDTALATFTYILVSYHIVLAFKVFTAEKQAALSLPLWQTILTHSAVLGLLIGLGIGRHAIPFFSVIRYFLPGLAPFEAEWLFSGGQPKIENLTDDAAIMAATVHVEPGQAGTKGSSSAAAAPAPSLYMASTGDDYNEFLELMRQGKRPFRKPGQSVTKEFELWLAARAKSRAAAAAPVSAQATSDVQA